MRCTACGGKCGPIDWAHERKCCPDCDCDRCGCDESIALRAELETVRRERDYLAGMASIEDLRVMRQELARGWLPKSERSDFDAVVGP